MHKKREAVQIHPIKPEEERQPRDQDRINKADPDQPRGRNPEEGTAAATVPAVTKKPESLESQWTSHTKVI